MCVCVCVCSKLDIKFGRFTPELCNVVLTKTKSRKAAYVDKITLEVWETREFDNSLIKFCNALYKKIRFRDGQKSASPHTLRMLLYNANNRSL